MIKIVIFLLFANVVATMGYFYNGPARYKFEYAVHDPHTQDIKNQWEAREGDQVRGSYSLIEADGSRRIVDYTADGHNGFNAVVRKQGHAYHPHGHRGYW